MDHVEVVIAVDPSVLVSQAAARDAFAREVSERVAELPYVVASPVTLELACASRPSRHPGLVEYPNLDRWLRPLIEALTGARRLLLGTTQVRTVDVSSMAPSADPRALLVRVVHDEDQRLPKAGLRLVEFPDGWCAPVSAHLDLRQARATTRRWSEALTAAAACRDGQHDLESQGFIRRRDAAHDVPVVPAGWLLGGSVDVPGAPRGRALAERPHAS